MQKPMSAPPTMEDVNRCVITPLVDSTAAVGQATSWMGMDSTVVTSMSVRMVMTTVTRMQTAVTQREVSTAPVTLATLEMESTV